MNSRVSSLFLFSFAVLFDQLTKLAVDSSFTLYDTRPIIGDFLCLHYIRNSGAAFGLHYGTATIMLVVTSLVTAALIYLFLSGKLDPGTKTGRTAVVFVIAGAVGNLIDRFRMREVIDFIDMGIGEYRWPTYNVADIFLTFGMIILIIHYLFFTQSSGNPGQPSDSV